MLPQFIRDAAGKEAPRDYENIQVAEAMRRVGLEAGDRVAYIGFDLAAAMLGWRRLT